MTEVYGATGFIGAKVNCSKAARLFLVFDKLLSHGDVDFKRLSCVNIVSYELPEGSFALEAFELYTLRYLKLLALDGKCEITDVYVREYASPDGRRAHFQASDERLNKLFAAGRETYRQNAVDIFTDCPSRERAGWLCDSFFTSRAATEFRVVTQGQGGSRRRSYQVPRAGSGSVRARRGVQNGPQIVSASHRRIEHARPAKQGGMANRVFSS